MIKEHKIIRNWLIIILCWIIFLIIILYLYGFDFLGLGVLITGSFMYIKKKSYKKWYEETQKRLYKE